MPCSAANLMATLTLALATAHAASGQPPLGPSFGNGVPGAIVVGVELDVCAVSTHACRVAPLPGLPAHAACPRCAARVRARVNAARPGAANPPPLRSPRAAAPPRRRAAAPPRRMTLFFGGPAALPARGHAGFPICAEPVVLVNHTLSATATHGVLHHFWETSADDIWVEYFLDGETTPSISFQPSMMCGAWRGVALHRKGRWAPPGATATATRTA